MRVGSPPLQPLPLPVGLKAFLFDGGVITVEVFVRTDEQPQLRVCVCVHACLSIRLSVCCMDVLLLFIFLGDFLFGLVVLMACQVNLFSLLPFNLDVMLFQTADRLDASLKRLLKRELHYFH